MPHCIFPQTWLRWRKLLSVHFFGYFCVSLKMCQDYFVPKLFLGCASPHIAQGFIHKMAPLAINAQKKMSTILQLLYYDVSNFSHFIKGMIQRDIKKTWLFNFKSLICQAVTYMLGIKSLICQALTDSTQWINWCAFHFVFQSRYFSLIVTGVACICRLTVERPDHHVLSGVWKLAPKQSRS